MGWSSKFVLLILMGITFLPSLVGVGYGVMVSFGFFSPTGLNQFTFKHYLALFQSGTLQQSFLFTLWVTFIATILSFIIAFVIAVLLRENNIVNLKSRAVLTVPLPIPHLAVGVLAILILSQSGLFSRVLHHTGIIESQLFFPELVYDQWGIGIILVYLWKEVPFLVMVMLGVLSIVVKNFELVAQSLGATKFQRLYFVTLPLIFRGSATSLIFVFVFILGAFEVPLLIGKSYPPMLSVYLFQRFSTANLEFKAESFAVSTMVSLTVILIAFLYQQRSLLYKRA